MQPFLQVRHVNSVEIRDVRVQNRRLYSQRKTLCMQVNLCSEPNVRALNILVWNGAEIMHAVLHTMAPCLPHSLALNVLLTVPCCSLAVAYTVAVPYLCSVFICIYLVIDTRSYGSEKHPSGHCHGQRWKIDASFFRFPGIDVEIIVTAIR